MPTSLYDSTVPLFIRSLTNLSKILDIAEKHAKDKKFDVAVLLGDRLAPDMFNLTQQVQYTYFMALDAASKLSGVGEPKLEYKETTVKELKASIAVTIKYLKSLKPVQFEGALEKKIALFYMLKKHVSAQEYVTALAVPNFYFHYAMAYALLRHDGVTLGKTDYTGPLAMLD